MKINAPLGMTADEWKAGIEKFAKAFARLTPEQTIKVNMADIAASNVAHFYRATNRLIEAEESARLENVNPTAYKPWISALYARFATCGQVLLSLKNWQEEFGSTEKEAIKEIADVVFWLENNKDEYGLSFHCAVEHLPMAEALALAKPVFNELNAQIRALQNFNN